jgi:hypothetical protein
VQGEGIFLSANEQQIFEIIGQVDSGKIKRDLACGLLDVSPRTLTRYLAGYRSSGLMFLKHGNRGRKPANTHPYEMKAAVGKIMLEVLYDFNMMHARDLVEERLGLKIPRETFRRWCHEFKAVKRGYRKRSKIRTKRTRQSQMGLIVQFDGSNHLWFGEEKSVLIAGIDDATSEVLWAGFYESENVVDCMEVLKEIIKKFGIFRMLYVDRAGLYGGIKRRGFSQITRALKELGTGVIYAQSPEGKGRVERLFRTLQDRLIPELRLNGIKTRELANRYLRDIYIKDHNRRFAVKPENVESGFTALDPKTILENIFCIKEQRTVGKDHTVSIKAIRYNVTPMDGVSLAGRRIEVRPEGPTGPEAYALGQRLDLEKIKPDRKQSEKDKVAG